MKLSVNPLIVAAAFGFLGPVALESDDGAPGIAGHWVRTTTDADCPQLDPGVEVDVLPVDDQVVVFDNRGESLVAMDHLSQEWELHGRQIQRSWSLEGESLVVTTTVEGGPRHTARFKRGV